MQEADLALNPLAIQFLIYGGVFTWEQAVEHLAAVRPELKSRLPSLPSSPEQYKDLSLIHI